MLYGPVPLVIHYANPEKDAPKRWRAERRPASWLAVTYAAVSMPIRELHERDTAGVLACIVQLQNDERELDARMPRGADIADAYLEYLFEQCEEFDGAIFVVEESGEIQGFVCVLSKYRSDGPDDGPRQYGLVSDLVVRPKARRRGYGRALLERAEAHARQAGATWLRIGVLAANFRAQRVYSASGFRPWLSYFEKSLACEADAAGNTAGTGSHANTLANRLPPGEDA